MKNFKWIDELVYVRGFAIISVIIIHVTMYAVIPQVQSPMYFFGYFLDDFAHFAVPVFIIASGISLSIAYRENLNLLFFYKRRILTVGPAFIFYTFLYAYLFPSEVSWYRRFILGEGTTHLYFIPLLLKLYLIFPILLWLAKKMANLKVVFALLMLIQLGLALRIEFINLFEKGFLVSHTRWNIVANDPIWTYAVLFFMGVISGVHFEKLYAYLQNTEDLHIFLLIAPLIPFLSTIHYFLQNFNPFFILILKEFYNIMAFILLFKLSRYVIETKGNFSRMINNISNYSFSIYLLHMVFIYYLVETLPHGYLKDTNFFFYVTLFVFPIYASYTISYLVNLLPIPIFLKQVFIGNTIAVSKSRSH